MIEAVIYSISILLSVLIICFFVKKLYDHFYKHLLVKDFADYMAVLQIHMEKAYDLIYKDRILAYSLDAYRIPDEEYNVASMEFVKAVNKLLGPMLVRKYSELYGDEQTFIFGLVEYFSNRYESDEIRKGALDNLKQAEIK